MFSITIFAAQLKVHDCNLWKAYNWYVILRQINWLDATYPGVFFIASTYHPILVSSQLRGISAFMKVFPHAPRFLRLFFYISLLCFRETKVKLPNDERRKEERGEGARKTKINLRAKSLKESIEIAWRWFDWSFTVCLLREVIKFSARKMEFVPTEAAVLSKISIAAESI